MKNILVFSNFTKASHQAEKLAIGFAKAHKARLHVHHVAMENGLASAANELEKIVSFAKSEGIEAVSVLEHGDFYALAPTMAKKVQPELVVIGSIGAESFDLAHFGSAIYKLVRSLPYPSLVLHSKSKLPANGFQKILLPIAPHPEFFKLFGAIKMLLSPEGSVFIYTVLHPKHAHEQVYVDNMQAAREYFESHHIKCEVLQEEASVTSGYAGLSLRAMATHGMDCIAIAADVSKRNQHFGKMEKEAVLANEEGYPIICVNTDL